MNENLQCPRWHVVYTMPKAERRVALSIGEIGIETYLPLCTIVRQWSDRLKKVEVPLFPNYVFVKVDEKTRRNVYKIKEPIRFISIDKRPAVVDEREIQTIRQVLSGGSKVSSEAYFQQGMMVRIKQGQFAGLEGIVIKRNGTTRLLVRIERLMKAYSFNISADMVEEATVAV
jgi:transcription antitermination factor NusG